MKNLELPFVKDMFEAIAPRYDFLNRFLSFRQDVYWRKTMVSVMKLSKGAKVLDVACGTGDVALEILKQKGTGVTVYGVDFSPGMLQLGNDKIRREKVDGSIHLMAGNALDLPVAPESFDAVTIAFGIRNIADKLSALKAFHGSLRKGGMLLVLELTTPASAFFRSLYLLYFKKILPLIGGFFSKNIKAYQYLPASVLDFPESSVFAGIMRSAGFSDVKWKNMTFGIVTLYVGHKH